MPSISPVAPGCGRLKAIPWWIGHQIGTGHCRCTSISVYLKACGLASSTPFSPRPAAGFGAGSVGQCHHRTDHQTGRPHLSRAGSRDLVKNAGPNWVISGLSKPHPALCPPALWFASFTYASSHLGPIKEAPPQSPDVEYGLGILRRNCGGVRHHPVAVHNAQNCQLNTPGIF